MRSVIVIQTNPDCVLEADCIEMLLRTILRHRLGESVNVKYFNIHELQSRHLFREVKKANSTKS